MWMIRRLALIEALLAITGCAYHFTDEAIESPYGVLSGFWHGVVFPFAATTNILSWAASLFGLDIWEHIQIIGRPNTGFFLLRWIPNRAFDMGRWGPVQTSLISSSSKLCGLRHA
jgi:hypothetical protein